MAITKELVKVHCPDRGCEKMLKAEITAEWDRMTPEEKQQLESQVRKRLLPGLKKHHKDGHPV